MQRDDVYRVIDSERDFQDEMTARDSNPEFVDMSMGDILLAIRHNLGLAESSWYPNAEPFEVSMEYLRKIAALSVKAGEKYGMKERFRCED